MSLMLVETHMLGGVHDKLPFDGSHAMLFMLRKHFVASNHQGIHIRNGSTYFFDEKFFEEECFKIEFE